MATRLRMARVGADLNQFQLALKADVPQSRLSLYDRGLAVPRHDEAERIAAALGHDVAVLFPEVVVEPQSAPPAA